MNLVFHSFTQMKEIILPILTTSPIYLSLEGCENVLCQLGSESVKLKKRQLPEWHNRSTSFSSAPPGWSRPQYNFLVNGKKEEKALSIGRKFGTSPMARHSSVGSCALQPSVKGPRGNVSVMRSFAHKTVMAVRLQRGSGTRDKQCV